ncbi:MAG TPA: tetratricopeptide repeat protein [Polyangia bacterium]|nr:tetratricopeptide repeat protein [Polyangia bacterium]
MSPTVDRCPDNLLARGRRGALSAVERRALDAHLGVCGLCRAALAFGSLFDEIPDRPGSEEDALVARLADRVAHGGRGAGRRRPARSLTGVAAAVALLGIAGGAAAWVSRRAWSPPRPAAALAVRSPRAPHIARTGLADVPNAPPTEPRPLPVASSSPRRRGHPPDHAASPSFDLPGLAEPTAADLFAAANATRRSGDLREAVRRYRALQRQYPGSAEAAVAHVSTGDLLTRLGDPAAALEQLDQYLSEHPEGPLAPEALVGRARCFEILRRRDEELRAWRELSRRFPGSIYQSAGQRRVEELTR